MTDFGYALAFSQKRGLLQPPFRHMLAAESAAALAESCSSAATTEFYYLVAKEAQELLHTLLRPIKQISLSPAEQAVVQELEQRGEIALGQAVDAYLAKCPYVNLAEPR